MEESILYPVLELGGVKYTLKATRGALRDRWSELGIELADRLNPHRTIAVTVKMLSTMITPKFSGSFEDLTDLILEEQKMGQVGDAINVALGKVFPPTIQEPVAAGARPAFQ
jgi:hypothetical protein